jgi:hypothetical protein
MKYSMVFAALAVTVALSGCEKKETVIQPTAPAPSTAPAPTPAPSVVPVPVPGRPGAPGAEGPKGEPGKSGGSSTVVIVPPAQDADKK